MIQHVVVIKFLADADTAAVRRFTEAVAALPRHVPGVRSFVCGPDVSRAMGQEFAQNWDYTVMATFASITDYQAYASHPAHAALKDDHLAAILQDRAGVQIELSEPAGE